MLLLLPDGFDLFTVSLILRHELLDPVRSVCDLGLEVVFEVLLSGFDFLCLLFQIFNPVLIVLLYCFLRLGQLLFDALLQIGPALLIDLIHHEDGLRASRLSGQLPLLLLDEVVQRCRGRQLEA